MNWAQVVERVTPYIMRIETPAGYGTGFLCLYNEDKSWCGIATAMHVVDYADDWQQPIRIRQTQTGKLAPLMPTDRIIFKDWKTDSAVMIFEKHDLSLPETLIPLYPIGNPISIGAEVCWLGFPQIQSYTLCFFSGNISAWQEFRKAYLIDGVAINGVSGGPVVYCTDADAIQVVGIISAYSANRASGEALPGLSIAQDVSHFHDVIGQIRSVEEAQHKKQEFEKSRQSSGGENPPSLSPSPSPSASPEG
jgi:hypothetical protein